MQSRLRIAVGTWCVSLVLLAGVQRGALAEQVVFNLDSVAVTLSGYDNYIDAPLVEQGPGSGSLTTTASGHFLVDFDPFDPSGKPTSLTFLFGHGFMEFHDNGNWLPGPNPATVLGSRTNPAPGNYAVQTASGEVKIVARNNTFDFINLDPLTPIAVNPVDGSFDPSKIGAKTLGGTLDFLHPAHPLDGGYVTFPLTGIAEGATGGTATLVESSPGSGQWTIQDGYAACN